jgi:hypothetical protein
MFQGRNLLIATKHEKEKVIAPILESQLGVKCFVASEFDTDELGTFTGEIERKGDPITTARNKCLIGMDLMDCDLAISSEGSFGSHPTIFFAPADDEFLLLIDKKNNIEISVRELSLETNFNGSEIKTKEELQEFATKSNFPSHGLILRKSKEELEEITKGIIDEKLLNSTFFKLIKNYGTAYIETDMRAMFNPSRMKVIEKATLKLVKKIKLVCPNCKTPGFGIVDRKVGLPCNQCRFPTKSTLSYLYNCQKCNYKKEEEFPNGKQTEDPMYCDICNP